jgi:hypothetical protein
MENFKKVLSYLKENYFLIICSLPLLVWILSSLSIASVKKDRANAISDCKSKCFPKQSEYISNDYSETCWCYSNDSVLTKEE